MSPRAPRTCTRVGGVSRGRVGPEAVCSQQLQATGLTRVFLNINANQATGWESLGSGLKGEKDLASRANCPHSQNQGQSPGRLLGAPQPCPLRVLSVLQL